MRHRFIQKNADNKCLGEDYFGTKRLKSPEENELDATIDELTSEFTLGAIIFDMFSEVENISERYEKGIFIPNEIGTFELSEKTYNILKKATDYDRSNRYKTIKEFHREFISEVKNTLHSSGEKIKMKEGSYYA